MVSTVILGSISSPLLIWLCGVYIRIDNDGPAVIKGQRDDAEQNDVLCKELMVEYIVYELHIVDKDGIITWSSDYHLVGRHIEQDFSDFLPLLDFENEESDSMLLPYNTTTGGFKFPDFGDGARRFFANVIAFFAGFASVLLYAVICGIPLCAVVALLYWLLFGKIGLLKKLFKKLRG